MLVTRNPQDIPTFRGSAGVRFLQYIARVTFGAVLQEVLKMPAEKGAELVERVIDSLDDDELELSTVDSPWVRRRPHWTDALKAAA